jgi:3-hydroxyacyl-[acyl-carrier-protein] dehydratase
MKYRQLDSIVSLQPGHEIVALRTLRAGEEYLLDHFPRFPVMPGVMMLEALHQAAMWLVRAGDNFESPLVLLREVRSVKFGDFLAPHETLEVTATLVKSEGSQHHLKASATKGGKVTVSARLILECCQCVDPHQFAANDLIRKKIRDQFEKLFGPVPSLA